MSKVIFLEKLLDGAEVEWVALGEVVNTITAPAKLNKQFYRNTGTLPIIDQGASFIAGYTDEDIKALPENKYVIFGDHSEHIKYVDFSFIQGADGLKILKPISNIAKYIFYSFTNFYTKELNYKRHWSRAKETLIPIPCPNNPKRSLAIQGEIVRILDTFTELTTELTARKKQYQYYRDRLLSFEHTTPSGSACHPSEGGEFPFLEKLLDGAEVEWVALGDEKIGNFVRGANLQKKDFTENGVGCIHYGQLYTHYGTYTHKTKSFVSEKFAKKARQAETGDLVIATTSENDDDVCKAVAWLGLESIAVSSDACIYKHKLEPKYVSYFFQTHNFQSQKKPLITGTKVRRVNSDNLAKILIPIPCPKNPKKSLEIQGEIVRILDTFDTLNHSITEGLPKEIQLRHKQYEYYRDLLLGFPKPPEADA